MLMQDKIVAAIHDIAKDNRLEAAESWKFSNSGMLIFTRPGKFEPLFSVVLSFQDDYMSGGVIYPGEQVVNNGPWKDGNNVRERCFFHRRYNESGQIDGVLAIIKREAGRF